MAVSFRVGGGLINRLLAVAHCRERGLSPRNGCATQIRTALCKRFHRSLIQPPDVVRPATLPATRRDRAHAKSTDHCRAEPAARLTFLLLRLNTIASVPNAALWHTGHYFMATEAVRAARSPAAARRCRRRPHPPPAPLRVGHIPR
jgi:hypothetical protein